MLEIENHWVLDALIGERDPFLLLSTIPPNEYLTSKCFQLLTRWRSGWIYPKTLAIVRLKPARTSARPMIAAISMASARNCFSLCTRYPITTLASRR